MNETGFGETPEQTRKCEFCETGVVIISAHDMSDYPFMCGHTACRDCKNDGVTCAINGHLLCPGESCREPLLCSDGIKRVFCYGHRKVLDKCDKCGGQFVDWYTIEPNYFIKEGCCGIPFTKCQSCFREYRKTGFATNEQCHSCLNHDVKLSKRACIDV